MPNRGFWLSTQYSDTKLSTSSIRLILPHSRVEAEKTQHMPIPWELIKSELRLSHQFLLYLVEVKNILSHREMRYNWPTRWINRWLESSTVENKPIGCSFEDSGTNRLISLSTFFSYKFLVPLSNSLHKFYAFFAITQTNECLGFGHVHDVVHYPVNLLGGITVQSLQIYRLVHI
jgi:hypothetical protein